MKKNLVLFCLLTILLMTASAAGAEELAEDDLLELLPNGKATGQLTRAGYAVMLSEAAGITAFNAELPPDVPAGAWYAEGIKNLIGNGIMAGYTDGTVKPEKNITRVEAVVMLNRVLGSPPLSAEGVKIAGLENYQWAAGPYTWCVKKGFLSAAQDPSGVITAREAAKLLVGVFGTKEQGQEINQKMERAMKQINAWHLDGTMNVAMELVPGAVREMPEEFTGGMNFKVKINADINKDRGVHQLMTIQFPKTAKVNLPEMTMEQYYTTEGMFVKTADPFTGESKWIKYPEGVIPDFNTLIKGQNSFVINDVQQMLHYLVLDEIEVNNAQCYELAFYGKIDDFNKLMSLINNMSGSLNKTTRVWEQNKGLIKSVSFMGTTAVRKDDFLPVSVDARVTVFFNRQFQGEPVPFTSMRCNLSLNYSHFNGDINIELPAEALEAGDLPLEKQRPNEEETEKQPAQ
ncbi:hypothetical protein JOC37_002332 [Desulfohalotomaculum tongense]|uniref:S-layer homology domain-containing protein n=1 Tax=Desulforadius tongensis TaxID=1216062 RepID=UPI0019561DEC|nr:S-layer homology domain-containing protein [Desulforadius tongensis]MBM7855910.1 hypothetical protein [Desulforadius tongensis]